MNPVLAAAKCFVALQLLLLCHSSFILAFMGSATLNRGCQTTTTRNDAPLFASILENGKQEDTTSMTRSPGRLAAILFTAATLCFSPPAALADEYGVEKEAPTLFTGETVLVSPAKKQRVFDSAVLGFV